MTTDDSLSVLFVQSTRVVMPDADKQPYVEDALDDDDSPIAGSRSYNSSAAPSVKEAANVSRTRNTDKTRRERSASPTKDLHDDSESDSAARRSPTKRGSKAHKEAKEKEKERTSEKSKAKRKSVTYENTRPYTGRAKTTPNLNIQTASSSSTSRWQPELASSPTITTAATAARPRAYTTHTTPRPVSYYGSPGAISRPPLSNTRYYASGPPAFGTSFPPPPQSPYPPQSPMFFPPTAPPYTGQYPPAQSFVPAAPAQGFGPLSADYFGQGPRAQALRQEYRRPRSAMGNHPLHAYDREYDDDDVEDGGAPVRGPSIRRRPSTRQQEEDRKLMPPPGLRRPSTFAAAHSAFHPPSRQRRPSTSSIQSIDRLDNDSIDDESQYSPSEYSRSNWRPHAVRRPNIDPTAYDVESRYERSPDGRRRNSQYGARTQSTERAYEDKFHHAQRYQETLDGPMTQLTADTLRKMTRTPSQRTKSTGSRGNESHALTNRNSIDTEDMRILVKGAATLTIGDASMAVQDGAEIRIPTNVGNGDRTSRGGSNGSDTNFDDRRLEDRHTRVDRPKTRVSRTMSRTGSRSRRLPATAGGYYPPPPPTEYSGHGGQYGHAPQMPAMYAPYSGYQYPG